MKEGPITPAEFEQRLAALCRGAGADLPRGRRDRHIIFRSVVQTLNPVEPYSEPSLNRALQRWSAEVGRGIGVDHVTLRRYLVDAGYLRRDPQGAVYQVHLDGRGEVEFQPTVSRIDAAAVVRAAREEAAARKRERLEQNS